ncbi:MAG: hypothetical protein M3347_05700 [Armatimonadota bacterium]|nr:hypothetical protein [Armatimonadota bacterium]
MMKTISALCLLCLLIAPFPVRAEQSVAKSIDLRPEFTKWRLPIKRQGARNTCAIFTLTSAFEYAYAKRWRRGGVRLSEEYLNWAANREMNDVEDGAIFSELLKGFNRWGICLEDYMPYGIYNPFYQPPAEAFDSAREFWSMGFVPHWIQQGHAGGGLTDADLEVARSMIRKGWPVCAGGEHCVLLVGYQEDPRQPGGGFFIVRNSATIRYENMTYATAKPKFNTLLWIELPNSPSHSQ